MTGPGASPLVVGGGAGSESTYQLIAAAYASALVSGLTPAASLVQAASSTTTLIANMNASIKETPRRPLTEATLASGLSIARTIPSPHVHPRCDRPGHAVGHAGSAALEVRRPLLSKSLRP